MTRKQRVFLVVRSDGHVRAAKSPRIAPNEVGIAIDLTFPDGWGKVTQAFDIAMPPPPVAVEPVAP